MKVNVKRMLNVAIATAPLGVLALGWSQTVGPDPLIKLHDVIMVSGGSHNLAVTGGGKLYAWGANDKGQIGDGTFATRLLPVRVPGLDTNVIAAKGSSLFSLALLYDGTLMAWGSNPHGQLGNGSTTPRTLPGPVSGLGSGSGVVAIAAGVLHALALKSDATVLAWGENFHGQLGNGTTTDSYAPVQVAGLGPGSGVIAIAAGFRSSMAIKTDGTVLTWGTNVNGQIGDNTTTNRLTPVQVIGLGPGSGVIAGASGGGLTGQGWNMALKSDGTVLAWGNNAEGQLGDGTMIGRRTPVQVFGLGAGSGVVQISANGGSGSKHVLALKSDGTVLAWGGNGSGSLGDGTTTNRLTPITVPGITRAIAVHAAEDHSLAVLENGTVLSWGANGMGQLGDDTISSALTPVQVAGLGVGSGVVQLATGFTHSLALKSDGTVLGWGDNNVGQLGPGVPAGAQPIPVRVTGLPGNVIKVAASNSFSAALLGDGTVLAWGVNNNFQLGNGTTVNNPTPGPVTGATGVVDISLGGGWGLALKSDGTMLAWGNNQSGQLGTGTTAQAPTAVPIPGVTGIVAIAAGHLMSLALKADGTMLAWGSNVFGQLGDGTLTNRLSPIVVPGVSGVIAIGASHLASYARKSDGTTLAWGSNGSGELGDGTFTQRTTATPIPALFGITALAPGNTHALALDASGHVLAWGTNGGGQLGIGPPLQPYNSPLAVTSLGSVAAVTTHQTSDHSFALLPDGTVMGWGANSSGQVGDGTTYPRNLTPSPVLFAPAQNDTSRQ